MCIYYRGVRLAFVSWACWWSGGDVVSLAVGDRLKMCALSLDLWHQGITPGKKTFKIQCGPVKTRSTSFKMLTTDTPIVRPWGKTGRAMGCLLWVQRTGHWFRWRLVVSLGNKPLPELMLVKLTWFLKYHPNCKLNNYRSETSCYKWSQESGPILGLRPASERRRYKVTPSLIGWAQTQKQPWLWYNETRLDIYSYNLNCSVRRWDGRCH